MSDGSHDHGFSAGELAQRARIAKGLREIGTKVLRLNGSAEDLAGTVDQVEALSAALDAVTERRARKTFRFQFELSDPNTIMPFNPATGALNPVAPDLEMKVEGDRLVTELAFPTRYESAPDLVQGGSVQGGMVSAIYDQLLAFAVMIHGKTGPSASLEVTFLKRTPTDERLRFETWVESTNADRYRVRGTCMLGDTRISEAQGLIIAKYDLPVAGGGGEPFSAP